MVIKKYIMAVGSSPSWPYGVEAPTFPDGQVIPADKVLKIVELSEHGLTHQEMLAKERMRWTRIAWAALRRFPELEGGESIRDVELRRRLTEIRSSGYEVQSGYSRYRKNEKWNYWMEIKEDVVANARRYCPEVLGKIARHNDAQKRDARGILS